MRNTYNFFFEKREGKKTLENLNVDGTIILTLSLSDHL